MEKASWYDSVHGWGSDSGDYWPQGETILIRYLNFLLLLALFSSQLGCSQSEDLESIRRDCQRLDQDCARNCSGKTFNTCYIDTKLFPNGPYNMATHCYATHVGDRCAPCSHRYAFNFGGVFREVQCEEFLAGIRRKDRECGGCLTKRGESPFAF